MTPARMRRARPVSHALHAVSARRLLLAGAGHSHVEVLRRFAMRPLERVDVTVVNPQPEFLYSAMVPGVVAGHYRADEAVIDVASLARRAGATWREDSVAGLDLAERRARLASGATIDFDILALDVGAQPGIPIAAHPDVVAVRPFNDLLARWERWRHEAIRGEIRSIVVVGGGAAGIELLLAMQFAIRSARHAPEFVLVSDRLNLPHALDVRLGLILHARGVRLSLGSPIRAVADGVVHRADGATMSADRIVIATAGEGARWLCASGLACDERGSVMVDAALRSTSHPFVFASGDCAALAHAPRPKAGVFAVREGPYVAHNLRATFANAPRRAYRPQQRWLAIVTTGERCAIAVRDRLAVSGRWTWHWKDRIDRAFVRRYAPPGPR